MKTTHLFYCGLIFLLGSLRAPAAGSTNVVRRSCCEAIETDRKPLTDKSLYQLDSVWTNDGGHAMKLSDLRGCPQVLVMFFTRCQYACPLLVYQMQQMEASLPPAVRANVGFTLVSFDSQRDTPSALREYRDLHGLSSANWTLLNGNPDAVLDLAALLGVKFKRGRAGRVLAFECHYALECGRRNCPSTSRLEHRQSRACPNPRTTGALNAD